jgi:hypothetical protein
MLFLVVCVIFLFLIFLPLSPLGQNIRFLCERYSLSINCFQLLDNYIEVLLASISIASSECLFLTSCFFYALIRLSMMRSRVLDFNP